MTPGSLSSATPYHFDNLPLFTREEVVLWNWYCSMVPGRPDWRAWVSDILGHLLEQPTSQQLQLTQGHMVDAQFGEKLLSFGSKQQLLLGRAAENDIVLPANAISSKHARVMLKDGRAYLEDFGGRLGTYLWDNRIPPHELHLLGNGDQFTIFPYRFRVFVETTYGPESNVALSQCQLQPMIRGEFMRTSDLAARKFVVTSGPDGDEALVEISAAFLAGLQQRILAPLGIDRSKCPVASDDTLLGFILLAFLERLNRNLKFPARFSFAKAGNPSSNKVRGMTLSFASDLHGLAGRFRIFLPLTFLSAHKAASPEGLTTRFPADLCWSFPISTGYVDLTPAEIAQIGLGDLVVIQANEAILFPSDFKRGWRIIREGGNFVRFRLDKYFEGGTVIDGGDARSTASQAVIQELPLRLHVVVGEKQLTLAEIQSLNPGTIIELDANKTAPVRLMVNGRFLGEGELVEVEGSLAVKVLGWRSA